MKKFFIIAGEASGDVLGGKLMRELKLKNPDAQFVGIGGSSMIEQGLQPIFSMNELSVMGFAEVLPHIPKLLKRIAQTAQKIREIKPDFTITIDSPDFSFRVMKKLINFKETKKIHLIAPSVWAYRKGRAKKISKLYDLLLTILPFEPPYFEKHGLKTVFIGHPIFEDAPDFGFKKKINTEFRQKHKIAQNDLLLCLTPGSRNGEVKKIFPQFIAAINLIKEQRQNIKVVIPLISKTKDLVIEMAKNLSVPYFFVDQKEKKDALFSTDFAFAKSGTNTLEFSLYRIPIIIAYKINLLSYFIIKSMIKIRFANLINLVLNKEVIPEMLQFDCDGKRIAQKFLAMIDNKNSLQLQVAECETGLALMGLNSKETPAKKAAQEIFNLLNTDSQIRK